MDQSQLKTSWKQRVMIFIVAILLLGSTIAVYALIVLNGNKSSTASTVDSELEQKVTEISTKITDKQNELTAASEKLSDKYLAKFKEYRSSVKSYNATTINNDGLTTKDLKKGSGKELDSGDTDYLAYYIGWCADESIFDSSFDDFEKPTKLGNPITGSNLIEGWTQGVIGMKLGGVREISIPGELAYADSREICGGYNSPLKFIVYALPDEGTEEVKNLWKELEDLQDEFYSLYYGSY